MAIIPYELSTQEKYQIMMNRLGTLINLYHIAVGFQNGNRSMFGIDATNIDDVSVRANSGVTDMRPVVEIVKDVNCLWAELSVDIMAQTDKFKAK